MQPETSISAKNVFPFFAFLGGQHDLQSPVHILDSSPIKLGSAEVLVQVLAIHADVDLSQLQVCVSVGMGM